jgi:isocitrate dehydrogenase
MTTKTVAKEDGTAPQIMDATINIILAAGAKVELDEIKVGSNIMP